MTDPDTPITAADSSAYRIAMVCLGNICRSPMADVVLNAHVARAGLADQVYVDSYGTGDWHVGQPMDRRAARTLTAAGYDSSRHRARQITSAKLRDYDLVLAMDSNNRTDLQQLLTSATRTARSGRAPMLHLFRDFDPAIAQDDFSARGDLATGQAREVPDPYYGGPEGFEEVLAMVERTAIEIVRRCLDGSLR